MKLKDEKNTIREIIKQMTARKTIIVFESYHHQNTEAIAQVIAQNLRAELYRTDQVDLTIIPEFDAIGIGSGIYFGKPHEKIQKFLKRLSLLKGKKVFLFFTYGAQQNSYSQFCKEKIASADVEFLDCFSCRGFDTHSLYQLVGGRNQGHPDLRDLYHAEIFANRLKNRL